MATVILEATKAATHLPPSPSPFAELLRCSRFASFDPAVRQTYFSPPEYAHRGNWGLKRPIAQKRRNAFITVKSYEEHAHYIEWSNAENEVRFIRRVEEMNALPTLNLQSKWFKGLGSARTEWAMDSDYSSPSPQDDLLPIDPTALTVDLDGLGQGGPGQYGRYRIAPGTKQHMQPNIQAMLPREFKRYLRRIRAQRQAFKEYMSDMQTNADNSPKSERKSMYSLAQNPSSHHGSFLAMQGGQQYNDVDSTKIEPQPHPNGGLVYAHPTRLESAFYTKPKPGFILHMHNNFNRRDITREPGMNCFLASFGGISAHLFSKTNPENMPTLLKPDSEKGVEQEDVEKSIAQMQLISRGGLELMALPRVVGRRPQGFQDVHIRAKVKLNSVEDIRARSNPHTPGTPQYISAEPLTTRGTVSSMGALAKQPIFGRHPTLNAGRNKAATRSVLEHLKTTMNVPQKSKKDD